MKGKPDEKTTDCAGTSCFGLVFMGQSIAYAADANQGKEMYLQYCSSCHGRGWRRKQRVRYAFLKVKVPDLTLLKKNNKGVYPVDQVILAIDGRRKLRSHGDPKGYAGVGRKL